MSPSILQPSVECFLMLCRSLASTTIIRLRLYCTIDHVYVDIVLFECISMDFNGGTLDGRETQVK